MQAAVRIPYMETDFLVLGGDANLNVYVAAHTSAELARPQGTAIFNGGTVFDRSTLSLSQDLDSRVPVDAYVMTVPLGDFSTAGNLTLTAYASGPEEEASDTVTLLTFPPPDTTAVVSTSSELRDALVLAKASPVQHFRIQFQTGTYTFPSSSDPQKILWDLSTTERLITFEPATGATPTIRDSEFFVRWAIWKGIIFTKTSAGGQIFALRNNSRHVFDSCRFQGQGTGTLGLDVSGDSDARLEDCVFDTLANCVVGASVIRGIFWKQISGIIFRNISRLLEGTVGYGLEAAVTNPEDNFWAIYDSGNWSPVIRHNLAVDMQGEILNQNSGSIFENSAIAGNVWMTHSQYGLTIDGLRGSYIAHNSIWTRPSEGNSLVITGTTFDSNYVVNNYFTRLGSSLDLVSRGGGTWDYNAAESGSVPGENSVNGAVPGFANKYLVLTKNSALLNRGLPQTGMETSFGTLPYQKQIGAMPFHPDTTLDSIFSAIIQQVDYGLSTKQSTAGHFQAPTTGLDFGGGALVFSDGTQSGLIAVI